MRLERLELMAYGPFTAKGLDFRKPFTIVYGPNEAGKTSALRALGDGLFGIPAQTPDDFVHPYGSLRIGISLKNGGGGLAFVRRKGRVQTLRAPDDVAALDDDALERILHGMTRETFETMFGISHAALVRGGRDIAEGRGEIGQLLFASAAGMTSLQATLRGLDEEAGELFAPRASSKSIHRSLRDLRDAEQELRRTQVAVVRFQENQKALAEASSEFAACDGRLEQLRREAGRILRIRDAMPTISARKQVLAELEELSNVRLLDADFGARLLDAERVLESARQAEAEYAAELERIAEAIAALRVPPDLLAADEAVRKLYEQKSAIRKSRQDCLRKEAELSQLRRSLLEQLPKLRPGLTLEEAALLEPGLLPRRRVQELAAEAPQLRADFRSLAAALDAARGKLTQCDKSLAKLPAAPDTSALAVLVSRASREVDAARGRKLRLDIKALDAKLAAGLQALGLWTATGEDLERLPVPAVETVEEFRAATQEAAAAVKSAREKLGEVERELAQAKSERDAVVAGHAVPTVQALFEARSVRELGWAAVQRVWRDGVAEAPEQQQFLACTGQSELGAGYAAAVAHADQIADRMREEAEKVERLTLLDAGIRNCEERRAEAAEAVVRETRAVEAVQARWIAMWAALGIVPESPASMSGWMRRRQAVVEIVADLREMRIALDAFDREEAAIAGGIREALAAYGPVPEGGLPDLLETAGAVLRQAQEVAERRRMLEGERLMHEREIARLEREQSEVRQKLSSWEQAWIEALTRIGLGPDTSPAAAEAYLAAVREIDSGLRSADDLADRIAKMQADAEAFAAAVAGLVGRLCPELVSLEPDAALTRIYQALLAANEDQKVLERERQRQRDLLAKLSDASQVARRRTGEVEALFREAGAAGMEDARAASEASNRRRTLGRSLAEYNERLLLVCGGKTIAEFLAEADAVPADSIAGRLDELDRQTVELKAKRESLEVQRRNLDADALAMQGGGEAARIVQRMSGFAGAITADVEQYVRLKTASFVLRKAFERYREKNQGPVLERAGQLFAELTCGSFAGLRVESVEAVSMLMGVRPGQGREGIPVSGMSDGACDQLYLALRIASLEHYFASHEPMPFIVDDVLLNFDDARARAALSVLDGLSARTQVIFFTHHKHLVELAAACTSAGVTGLNLPV